MIKPCKLNESVVAINNTACIYHLTCVWVFCFLKVQQFNLSLTLTLNYTEATRSRAGLVNCHFWILILRMACSLHVVETYIKGTSWKRCYLVTSLRLLKSQIRYQFCWFQQKLKSRKVTIFFFKSPSFWSRRSHKCFSMDVF